MAAWTEGEGGSVKWLDFGSFLKGEQTGFAGRLGVGVREK